MNRTLPTVFAVGDTYHIMTVVDAPSLMWVKVGEACYYDESNGILRSETSVHRMIVPVSELNKHGKYTICERRIVERKPYFTQTEDLTEEEFDFYPVKSGKIRAYHISDAHNMVDEPVAAANVFGKIDFLILNGDIPSDSGNVENIISVFRICERITKGNIPVVFSRGNHDMRGVMAEKFADLTPTDKGNSYYTFRLGDIWGILLDCGEDKPDGHDAYGHTIACRQFRQRQTKFLESIIENADKEYNADGTEHRIVISHVPFTQHFKEPFNIDEDIYENWTGLLRENVKPHMILCGHTHTVEIIKKGSGKDAYNQPCTVVVGAKPKFSGLPEGEVCYFAGTGLEFEKGVIKVTFTDSQGKILESAKVR